MYLTLRCVDKTLSIILQWYNLDSKPPILLSTSLDQDQRYGYQFRIQRNIRAKMILR